MRYLRYLKHRFEYDSRLQFALNGMGFLGFEIHPFYVFLEGIRADVAPPAKQPVERLEVGFLRSEHVPAIATFPDRKIPERTFIERFSKGDLCLGARRGDELVAFSWASLGLWSYWGRLELNESEAYLYDAYTALPHRGRGIAPALRYRLYEELEKYGKTRFYSVSERLNRPSLRFKVKLGATIIDSGIHMILLKRCHLGRAAASPRHQLQRLLQQR